MEVKSVVYKALNITKSMVYMNKRKVNDPKRKIYGNLKNTKLFWEW